MRRIRKALTEVLPISLFWGPYLSHAAEQKLHADERQINPATLPPTHNVECWALLQQVVIAYERLQARYAAAQGALAQMEFDREQSVDGDRGDGKDEKIGRLEKTVADLKLLAILQRGAIEEANDEVDKLNDCIDDFVARMARLTESEQASRAKPEATRVEAVRKPMDDLDSDWRRRAGRVIRFKRDVESLAA